MENNESMRTREVLEAAHRAWMKMADVRSRRERYKNFTYGRQWSDTMLDEDGRCISEEELASRNGRTPLTNNLIRQLVKCVIGRYREQRRKSATPLGRGMAKVYGVNQLNELDCRTLEEFLISGCAIQRVVSERRPMGNGVWVDNVSPRRFFVNRICDIRGWDTELIGMLHDMSLAEVLMRFGRGDGRRIESLKRIYRDRQQSEQSDSFYSAASGRCRVIEVWTLESRELIECHDPEKGSMSVMRTDGAEALNRENATREAEGRESLKWRTVVDTCWHCRYISPGGELLHERQSDLASGEHPFVVKLYPLTDGEIHSFVEDIIDQQKYVNRLITLIDHVMSTSAKGALLFPYRQKLENMTWEEVGQQWASCDGIIPYDPRIGEPVPQQIASRNCDIGAYDLLELEMKLFRDVSGVSEVLSGHGTSGAKGSTMYESQVQNATVALADLLETYGGFISNRDRVIKESIEVTTLTNK